MVTPAQVPKPVMLACVSLVTLWLRDCLLAVAVGCRAVAGCAEQPRYHRVERGGGNGPCNDARRRVSEGENESEREREREREKEGVMPHVRTTRSGHHC